jgi:hypothetical protein
MNRELDADVIEAKGRWPGAKAHLRRATALVLVVVLLALLAIMASTFVLTSRITLQTAKNLVTGGDGQVSDRDINAATDTVVSVIQSTLAEDLWGNIDPVELNKPDTGALAIQAMKQQRLLGLPCDSLGDSYYGVMGQHAPLPTLFRNEHWDAPWTPAGATNVNYFYHNSGAWQLPLAVPIDGDPWLANSDPAAGQRTNLFSIPWPVGNPIGWDAGLITAGLGPLAADADGDGTPDSVWLVQRNAFPLNAAGFAEINGQPIGVPADLPFTGGTGLTYRMAVRIVDTCGMVNVNTAWQFPNNLPAAANPTETLNSFMGNFLTGVNLYGYFYDVPTTSFKCSSTFGYNNTDLPGRVSANATLQGLYNFQNDFIFRIENPNWTGMTTNFPNFYPLDLSNEMELRFRWNQPTSGINTPLKTIFGLTGNPPNPRPELTAYSFSRNIRRILTTDNGANWNIDNPATNIQNQTGRNGTNQNGIPRKKNLDLALKIWRDVNIGTYHPRNDEAIAEARTLPTNLTSDAEFVSSLYGAFYSARRQAPYSDTPINAQSNASWLAAQYLVNLVDYFDSTGLNKVTAYSTTGLNNKCGSAVLPAWNTATYGTYVYGNKPHLVISEVYIYKDDSGNTYSAIEIYNPWTSIDFPAVSHRLTVFNNLGIPQFSAISLPAVPRGGFIFVATTPFSGAPPSLLGTTPVLPHQLASGDQIILFHEATPSTSWALVDNFTISEPIPNAPVGPPPGICSDIDITRYTTPVAPPIQCDWQALADSHQFTTPHSSASIVSFINPATLGALNIGISPNTPFSMPYKIRTGGATLQEQISNESLNNFSEANLVWLEGAQLIPIAGGGFTPRTPAQLIVPNAGTEQNLRPSFNHVYGQNLMEFFSLLGRDDDGINQISSGADSLDEMRLPGLININTAPATVLQALHPYITAAVAGAIITNPNRPYHSVTDVLAQIPKPAAATVDLGTQGVLNDLEETQLAWSRIANLITVRSDTFAAYILLQALDKSGTVVSQRREIVLFDRSLCNQPPLVWNDATKTPASQWVPNPKYRAPKVVARQPID